MSDKSWKVCQEQSNGVIANSLNDTVYDSELVTIKYFISITYTVYKMCDCKTVVSTLVQANRAKFIGTNLNVSFELNIVLYKIPLVQIHQ